MKLNIINSHIEDDDNVMFPIVVTYEIKPMLFVKDKVLNIDWELDSAAKIAYQDLEQIVKELIKDEERTSQIDFI